MTFNFCNMDDATLVELSSAVFAERKRRFLKNNLHKLPPRLREAKWGIEEIRAYAATNSISLIEAKWVVDYYRDLHA